MEFVEFDGPNGVAELGEHASSPNGRKLIGIADEHEAPSVSIDVFDEAVEIGSVEHACLVDDESGAVGEPGDDGVGTRIVEVPDQFGDGVGVKVRLPVQHIGASGGRGNADHGSTTVLQVVHGGVEHAGLAGARRPDDDHELVLSGDRTRSCELGLVDVERIDVDGRARVVDLCAHRPGEDSLLLGEDVLARRLCGDRFGPNRSSVGRSALAGVAGGVEVNAVGEDGVDGVLEGGGPTRSVLAGLGRGEVAQRAEHVEAVPHGSVFSKFGEDRIDSNWFWGWCDASGLRHRCGERACVDAECGRLRAPADA